jgi:hypothetical protein
MLSEMKVLRLVNVGCLAAIVAFISACEGKPMVEEELFGKYELVASRFPGSLELKSDYTFVQEFVVAVNETKIARGKWDYDTPGNGNVNRGRVGIYGAILEDEGKLVQMKFDFAIFLPVFADWKGVSLWLDPDGDSAYFKKAK